ncbi:hypothetical protein KKHLCK_01915 [Candidatus Electrothrix laxa]
MQRIEDIFFRGRINRSGWCVNGSPSRNFAPIIEKVGAVGGWSTKKEKGIQLNLS